ncbi:MAG: glycosyltransferase family 2 protein [Burkholderiales bacterium]|nr:glycosyltransferase family 2 protein [Burkholderiales bacterium]
MPDNTNTLPDGADRGKITLSVVSHGQSRLLAPLLKDLARHCGDTVEVILTLNLPETLPVNTADLPFRVRIIENPLPKGFADNHNSAFRTGCTGYFCVLNPDIRLEKNPFPELLKILDQPQVGVVAPLIMDSGRNIADSARTFPTITSVIGKAFGRKTVTDYEISDRTIFPDWVAGMFMLFRRDVFVEIGGFDENYFLYYEDVDICARLRLDGYLVALCPRASAIHDAQRTSHHNLRYLKWHLGSMLRFFRLSACRKIRAALHKEKSAKP